MVATWSGLLGVLVFEHREVLGRIYMGLVQQAPTGSALTSLLTPRVRLVMCVCSSENKKIVSQVVVVVFSVLWFR